MESYFCYRASETWGRHVPVINLLPLSFKLPFSRCSVITHGIPLGIFFFAVSMVWSFLSSGRCWDIARGSGSEFFGCNTGEKGRVFSSVDVQTSGEALLSQELRIWGILSDAGASDWQESLLAPLRMETCTLKTSPPRIPVDLLPSKTPRFPLQEFPIPRLPASQSFPGPLHAHTIGCLFSICVPERVVSCLVNDCGTTLVWPNRWTSLLSSGLN